MRFHFHTPLPPPDNPVRKIWNCDFIAFPVVEGANPDIEDIVDQICDVWEAQGYLASGELAHTGTFEFHKIGSENTPDIKRLMKNSADALVPTDPPPTSFPNSHWYHNNGVLAVQPLVDELMSTLQAAISARNLAPPEWYLGDFEDKPSVIDSLELNSAGQQVGFWPSMLADSRATNPAYTPCMVWDASAPAQVAYRTASQVASTLPVPRLDKSWLDPSNHAFSNAMQSRTIGVSAYTQWRAIHSRVKNVFPLCKVCNYEDYAVGAGYQFLEGSGSLTWRADSPEVIHPSQDAVAPQCYSVPPVYVQPGESVSQMQVRVFRERIAACSTNRQGKPVVPWMMAPRAFLEQPEPFVMDKDTCLAQLNEAYALGVRRVIFWANTGAWHWDDIAWVITTFNQQHGL